MISLIVLIVACVMINNKAKEKGVAAAPYILGAIFLAIIPSLVLHLILGTSMGVVLISAILSIALCFVPYNILKSKENDDVLDV